ncbi:MAG: DUF5069 domain-containing protein [Opitutales bacterium]
MAIPSAGEDILAGDLGPTGAILRSLPSPYLPHGLTGLLHLPRFLAKCRRMVTDGELPRSYRKNFMRGFDRFLCMHLGIDPGDVLAIVEETGGDATACDAKLLARFPAEVDARAWNRSLVQRGMSAAGRDFLKTALTEMGCTHRARDIISVCDLIDFDEGRIPGYEPSGTWIEGYGPEMFQD